MDSLRVIVHSVAVAAYGVLFVVAGGSIALRFSNPSLTETQLFLLLWPYGILAVLVALGVLAWVEAKYG